jgi:hypothetical protein
MTERPTEKALTAVFENRMLRRIFRPKSVEIIRGWRKLHKGLKSFLLVKYYALKTYEGVKV